MLRSPEFSQNHHTHAPLLHTGLAVATPGELRGLELLHRRHGSLPWADLVRPAMELARDGFEVGPYLDYAIWSEEEYVRRTPELRRVLTNPDDGATLLKRGDRMVRDRYAKTLEAVMHGGADAVYEGDLARMLAKASFSHRDIYIRSFWRQSIREGRIYI